MGRRCRRISHPHVRSEGCRRRCACGGLAAGETRRATTASPARLEVHAKAASAAGRSPSSTPPSRGPAGLEPSPVAIRPHRSYVTQRCPYGVERAVVAIRGASPSGGGICRAGRDVAGGGAQFSSDGGARAHVAANGPKGASRRRGASESRREERGPRAGQSGGVFTASYDVRADDASHIAAIAASPTKPRDINRGIAVDHPARGRSGRTDAKRVYGASRPSTRPAFTSTSSQALDGRCLVHPTPFDATSGCTSCRYPFVQRPPFA